MNNGIEFETVEANGVSLHLARVGDETKPLIVCLHGFPEYWAAWREVMLALAGEFFLVAPDQRGFNLSSKPEGVEAYRTRNMVADLSALADRLSPGRPFILAGHDWGASVAYAYAFAHPERLSHLVVANGAHPVCFQRAILADMDQRKASQYFHALRAEGAAERMADNDFARTMKMIAGFSKVDWMTPAIAAGYRAAWGKPGAMQAMLHWYNSSPVVVPAPDAEVADAPLLTVADDKVTVRMPHLVIWGDADEALRPVCLDGLDRYAADLTIRHVAGAGHWVLHEKPVEVAAAIRSFVAR